MTEGQDLKVVVVDDEPLARRGVIQLLAKQTDVEFVGEAGDAQAALRVIATTQPDVVFLDIEMPGISGLELAALIEGPLVVFITAFDEYAVAAFEARALDYLLKPVDPVRFQKMWDLVRSRHAAGQSPVALNHELVSELNQQRGVPERLVIPNSDKLNVVLLSSVLWVESADNYVVVHAEDRRYMWRRSLADLASQYQSAGLVRIHRSALVQLAAVDEVNSKERGDFVVVLSNGDKVDGSRRYRTAFLASLKD